MMSGGQRQVVKESPFLIEASPVTLTRWCTCGHYSTVQDPGRQKDTCSCCAPGGLILQENMK